MNKNNSVMKKELSAELEVSPYTWIFICAWFFFSVAFGEIFSRLFYPPYFILWMYSGYRGYMLPDEYNLFCFSVFFVLLLMPFFSFWWWHIGIKKASISRGRLLLIAFGVTIFFVTLFGQVEPNSDGLTVGRGKNIELLFKLGWMGITFFLFASWAFSMLMIIAAIKAKKN